jgi:hypothetical protein
MDDPDCELLRIEDSCAPEGYRYIFSYIKFELWGEVGVLKDRWCVASFGDGIVREPPALAGSDAEFAEELRL